MSFPLLGMKVLTGFLVFGLTASTVRVVNFDNFPLGRIPPGWTVAMTNRGRAPQWEVRIDPTAPTRPHVLAQLSADAVGDRYPLAIWNGAVLNDGEVSVRLRPVAGREVQAGGVVWREVQAGGVVWRYRDENNYYLARFNALDHNVQVFKVEHGRRTPLVAGARHDIPANAWSTLKVWVRGNRFQVYMDHRRILQGQDNTFTGSGRVGLWTVGDSVTYFDDFRVVQR